MPARIATFQNLRARFLSTKEGKWHYAWIVHLGREDVRLRLNSPAELPTGERVLGECFGDGAMVRFAGCLVGQAGPVVAIRVVGGLSFEPSMEDARVCVEGITGCLEQGSQMRMLEVLDISHNSLGVRYSEPLHVGTAMALRLDTRVGEIMSTVTVLNCRPEPGRDYAYRVGLHIIDIKRLDAARWSRLISELTE